MKIVNLILIKNKFMTRYTWPIEITFDQVLELIRHDIKNMLI